jgi:membrane-bound serine protease (ClpP class)
MMDFLLTPDIAYLCLVGFFLCTVLSVLTLGTGVFEAAALLFFALSAWQAYRLPINGWALLLLLAGVVLFLLAVRRSGRLVYLGLAIAALVVGSAYFFKGETWLPAVNLWLALAVSGITTVLMWLVTVKTLEAHAALPSHDLSPLIGALGVAKSDIHRAGTVYVRMEDWSAQSEAAIPAGAQVRVLGREGLILQVEEVKS